MLRLDRLPPLSLFLATLAGWALICALVVAAGVGRRLGSLADDPSLVSPLPELALSREGGGLGPVGEYAEVASRPLFSSDRRPGPADAGAVADEGSADFDYTLTSVILTDELKLAILHDDKNVSTRARLDEGVEAAPSWRLVELSPRQAVFEGPEGRRSLDLRVFDGTGGEPPTARQAPPPPPRGQPPRQAPANINLPDAPKAEPEAESMTPEQQADLIRQRIEARRAQLRQEAAERQQNQNQKEQ